MDHSDAPLLFKSAANWGLDHVCAEMILFRLLTCRCDFDLHR